MNRIVSICSCLLVWVQATPQSTAWITGTRDTSYNLTNEYNKHLKNYPGLKIAERISHPSVKEEKDISFCQTAERELKTDVFYPADLKNKKRTAIIFIHGGGWRSGNKKMHHPLAQQLALKGFVCFTPEYRLSTEALFPAGVYDVKSAIRWVRKNAGTYNIDKEQIVIAGHSAGGELAAFMGATNGLNYWEGNGCEKNFSSRVNAVIDLDGTLAFIHPESGEGDDSKKISAATQWFGYSKTENPQVWKWAAPLSHAGPHCPPILFINSGVDRMHAGREDFKRIIDQFRIYHETKTFTDSPHSFVLFNPWFDSTVQIMEKFINKVFVQSRPKKLQQIIVVQDGSGDFTHIQDAFNAIPYNNTRETDILVKAGTYKEKLFLDSSKNFVRLIAKNNTTTIITYNDHTGKIAPSGDTINTRTSWTFKIKADDFRAMNISFENNAGFNAGQAVAVESNGDKVIFKNCRFTGNQDVLFTNNDQSRQYFEDCYIEGTTDFIFGSATVWFEKCRIYSKKNSHITAASTPKEKEFGYVFNRCQLEGDSTLRNVSLGRPWRPYAAVAYLHCYIGPHIKPEGWSKWNNNENHLTSRYAEFNNSGPSAKPEGRVKWARQLTAEEAKKYSFKNIFRDWNPLQ